MGVNMRRNFAIIPFASLLVGCGSFDPAAYLKGLSAPQFITGIGTVSKREQDLIAAYQLENASLGYLSRGTYSCGDPKSTLAIRLKTRDPVKIVKDDKIDKHWTNAKTVVENYVEALTNIVNDNTKTQDSFTKASQASVALKYIPGVPPGSDVALTAIIKLAGDVAVLVSLGELKQKAKDAEPALKAAIASLKRYYPDFEANERAAFRAWDSCALEKLAFIRDQPFSLVKYYEPTAREKQFFYPSDATKLDAAFLAYLEQRKTFKDNPALLSLLDKIILENQKIYAPDTTWESLQAAGNEGKQLYSDVTGVLDAGDKVMKAAEAK